MNRKSLRTRQESNYRRISVPTVKRNDTEKECTQNSTRIIKRTLGVRKRRNAGKCLSDVQIQMIDEEA